MQVTTKHSASRYGVPVILNGDGDVMDYATGIKAIRKYLGLSAKELASLCNVSTSTVYGWQYGRMPEVAALNVITELCVSGCEDKD